MRATLTSTIALLAAATITVAAGPLDWYQHEFRPYAYEKWIWKDLGYNVCADGSQTGFAYNMKENATELLIFFQGGGGCWDTQSCFTHPKADNVNGFNSSSFAMTESTFTKLVTFTSRKPHKKNPWANANLVFVPYCTADFHAGDAVNTYAGAPAPIHHKGYNNFQNILKFLADAVPPVTDVWMTGFSAGCFGATLNYNAAKKTWPLARTHLIGDSCEATPGYLNTKPMWKLRQPSKAKCPNCVNSEFNTFLPAFSQANPHSRFGSISFANESVLISYLDYISVEKMYTIVAGYFANITSTATNQAKTFVMPGKGHGVVYKPNPTSRGGITLASWLATVKDLSKPFKSV